MRVMKIFHILFACSALAVLSGCGNSELESAVYRQHAGLIRCANLSCSNQDSYGTLEYDPLVGFTKAYKHSIDHIELKKGKVSHVWDVDVWYICPKEGLSFVSEEWSWKDDKAVFLKRK